MNDGQQTAGNSQGNPTGGADSQGNQGGASGGNQQASGQGSGAQAQWFDSFQNQEYKGYVQTKGFKDPEALVESYRNLEKAIGVPPDRLLKLPEKLEDQALMPIFDKLGRPEKPDGYNIKPAQGGDENFTKFAQGLFHEAGLTKSQGEKLAAKWDEYIKTQNDAAVQSFNVKVQQENETLKKEWGQAYDQNVEIGKNAVAKFGMDKETLDKLEAVMGFAGLMRFAHNLGKGLGEDNFVGPNGKKGGFGGVLTPQEAQYKIKSLGRDAEWVKRYAAGGAKEREEMEMLHKMAYPENA